MNVQLRILCRPEVGAGFSLAGVPVLETASPADATATVTELLTDPTVGVILIEESLHEHLPEDLRRRLARRPSPLVVPFPGPAWDERAGSGESYIVELLRQVIGYRVRLR